MNEEKKTPAAPGIELAYYLRLAIRIASFDDLAVRQASSDPDAAAYGAIFSMMIASVVFLVTALPKILSREGATAATIFWGLLLGHLYVWVWMGLTALVQIGICHGIAKVFLSATGTFAGAIRPSLLGWFVNILVLIPSIGLITSLIAWTAVLMTVLKEVDGLSRTRAFLVTAGSNGSYYLLFLLVQHFQQ